ncbi:ISNCY family transposase [Tannockella kyphosi]|uniref:ISNCY family transposase n=1 Tax=Tannockella kyphosi TaxID=2899121 RepID=UPI002011C0B2|nr:ISNCY family transposase [Tannockella kyphosi]
MNEQQKYEVIKNLVDNNGNKNSAAVTLGLSRRQIDRLIVNYKEKGKSSFVHGNRSKKPSTSIDVSISTRIIQLYKEKYYDCNFNHFKDLLNDWENIQVSYNYLYKLLMKENIHSPRIRKLTRKAMKKKELLLLKQNQEKTEEDIDIMVNHLIDIEDSHPRQEKPKYFGEIIEMDGSIHPWFGLNKACLHLAIDVCTGTIVGGYFQEQETLRGYYHVYKQILTDYGIPYQFKTDNRTVFHYESINKSKRTSDKDVLTQFGYACKQFGTDIVTTSVAQAKGTIERANGTFQGRLVQELRMKGITTMKEANKYLTKYFIPDFNKRFALNYKKFPSVMEEKPTQEKINYTLAILTPRKIDRGSAIKYFNNTYQVYDKDSKLQCFMPKTECLVIKAFDGTLLVTVDEAVYQLKKLESHKKVSENIDFVEEEKPKNVYIPPMTHPWKKASFDRQVKKAHTQRVYA